MIPCWSGRSRAVFPSVLGLMLVLAAAPSRATVIVDTFGAGDTFRQNIGWAIRGSTADLNIPELDQGHAFTIGSTSIVLTDIFIALAHATGTNAGDLLLMTDSAGVPDSVLKTYTVTGMGAFGTAYAPTHIVDALGPTLLAGNRYWLIASAAADDAHLDWNLNDQGLSGDVARRLSGGAFSVVGNQPLGAYRIEGTESPIPEPSTLALLAAGTIGLLRRRIQRHP